ncbi:helix-turn-helix domain-containing protein [Actinomadura harenae]|nr:helix-turn-helix domain-containing protein [Actinomadura harenae]
MTAGLGDGRPATQSETVRRLVTRPDGLQALLRWLASQINGYVVLADAKGEPLQASPRWPTELLADAREGIRRVATGKAASATVDTASHTVWVSTAGGEDPPLILVVASGKPFSSQRRKLISEASGYLWLRWRLEELQRHSERIELANEQSHEAALQLLLVGDSAAARRVTQALGSFLPEVTRVCIIECPPRLRDECLKECEQAIHGRVWLVRCPVYTRHLIILAPPKREDASDPLDEALGAIVANRRNCYVGIGQAVHLRDIETGYEQAFHALAVARNSAERHATFSPRDELASLIGPVGRRWAAGRIQPLLDHRPRRAQDPDTAELQTTFASWLNFSTRAPRQLKIHRNTLAGRLRLIADLLDCDLDDLATLAELHLAQRLLSQPRRAGEFDDVSDEVSLDRLLGAPHVVRWAQNRLSDVGKSDPRLLHTLRVWLGNNGHLPSTARSLRLSVPATRKRILRVEQILERSLLNAPSALCDMQLAIRIVDGRDEKG